MVGNMAIKERREKERKEKKSCVSIRETTTMTKRRENTSTTSARSFENRCRLRTLFDYLSSNLSYPFFSFVF